MYAVDPQLGALPSWLTNIANKIVQGTSVIVPTPAGPVTIDLGNKASVDAAKAALTGARITTTVTRQPPVSPFEQADYTVRQQVPGGWLTIAAAGALALFVLPKLLRRR